MIDYRMMHFKDLDSYNKEDIPTRARILEIAYQYIKGDISYLDAVDAEEKVGAVINYLNIDENIKQTFIDVREGRQFLLLQELDAYYELIMENAYRNIGIKSLEDFDIESDIEYQRGEEEEEDWQKEQPAIRDINIDEYGNFINPRDFF